MLFRSGAALAASEASAIRKAVASRIDILDEAFLVTLMGFVQASEAEGASGMSGSRWKGAAGTLGHMD